MTPGFVARKKALAIPIFALALSACGGGDTVVRNALPSGVTTFSKNAYLASTTGSGSTAATQDLLTAGLGKTGLSAAAPTYADPSNPTALELRRNALYSNYRGLVDYTANGGFGTLYGPNIDLSGNSTLGEGLIPGVEYLGVLDDGTGRKNVTMAIQIPSSFNPKSPCIVVGPSSGSRGVYGAIATAGEWGLKRGCAVALTDAGKGVGLYDPTDDSVTKIDGTRTTRSLAGLLSNFAANITDAARIAFNTAFPNRLSLKQAHSQLNPEKDWGSDSLVAAHYALYAINQEYGTKLPDGTIEAVFRPGNTMVIAASVSNGGGAVLRAGELDTQGLISGIVAGEPNAQVASTTGYGILQGGTTVSALGKPLLDYFTYANIYQPCAALAPAAALTETSYFNFIALAGMTARATNRCIALYNKGLVSGTSVSDTAGQAADALDKLRAYGWLMDSDQMHNAHYALGNAAIISSMYTNAHGRFSLTDNICGISFGQVDGSGNVMTVSTSVKAQNFAVGNGTSNGTPATVIYNDSVGGAKSWALATSPSTTLADFGLDAALCQRALATGLDPVAGTALTASTTPTKAQSDAVRLGMAEVQVNGNLHGKPTLILQGRSDALLPINHTGRAYTAYNHAAEGATSKLRFIEVTNAQHFDGFIPLSGFDTRYVPLHYYFLQAMNAMYANLKNGTSLPASQVVRTTPRGGTPGLAPAITQTNVPSIASTPLTGDAIGFTGTTLTVPN